MEVLFRFQTLDVWYMANEIGDELLDIAGDLEAIKLYRFAEQLRGSSLSVLNNIAKAPVQTHPGNSVAS